MPSSGLIVIDDGREAVAELIKAQTLWMGLGNLTTSTPWSESITPPNFDPTKSQLEHELVRRKADLVVYVIPDVNGDIVTDTGESFTIISEGRSNLLLTRFLFLPTTVSETDYQLGVFMNCTQNMAKPSMTMKVNNAASPGNPITAGAKSFQADSFVGGTPADLMPVSAEKLKPGFGRTFSHGGVTYIITKVDFGSAIIYIDRADALGTGFATTVPDDTTFTVAAITGVPEGQKQLIYPYPAAVPSVPGEVFNPGDLFVARNIQPVVRSPGARTQFDLIISV